jgi:polysaccharide pyruvyl transferase WcaK-like protein
MSRSRALHILVVNQHGENRGDEAAMRAMLAAFEEELGDVEFTLLYQFQDRSLRLSFRENVRDLPIVIPPREGLGLAMFSLTKLGRLSVRKLLGPTARAIIDAYEKADIVVSAPGGPYFGDIYRNHELVHWFYIWLGALYRKPLFLYATSAGPFETAWLNPLRKRLYPKFDVLCTREELSAENIRGLLGSNIRVHVTADSALQQNFDPLPRCEYFTDDASGLASKVLVAVSLNDYKYPGDPDVQSRKRNYDDVIVNLLSHVAERRDCHLLLLPQLYGAIHQDAPYLERMGRSLPSNISWEVVDVALDSDAQRRIFAMCDLHVASRYHPAIFANSGLTPGICIYYEHKALGFMQQLGLERFAFDIRTVDANELCTAVDEVLERREELIAILEERIPPLREAARRTTKLAVELLEKRNREESNAEALP